MAVLIALGSVVYGRRQAIASDQVAAIENKRHHHDLTPQLVIRCRTVQVEIAPSPDPASLVHRTRTRGHAMGRAMPGNHVCSSKGG